MSIQEEKLKAIADAIREKDGTTELIPANDFPERIRAISSVPDGLRTITLAADPPEGGTVSGGGVASDGMTVTVKAEAAEGYNSAGWQENGEDVSEEPEYTFTVTGDRSLVAAFTEKTSRIPDGYTEVEYIQTDSNFGVDTELVLKPNKTRIVMDFVAEAHVTPYRPVGGTAYTFWIARTAENTLSFRIGTSNTTVNRTINLTGQRTTLDVDLVASTIKVMDEIISLGSTNPDTKHNIYIAANTEGKGWGSILMSLYSVKIYEDAEIFRDYVPCINPSAESGLYDLISQKFYPNSLSGKLTPGPAV